MNWKAFKERIMDRIDNALWPCQLPEQAGLTIRVLSRDLAERYTPTSGEVCISIVNPGNFPASLQDGWADVLRLKFDDIDDDKRLRATMMKADDARQILDFTRKHAGAPIVVHDELGGGRAVSVGVYLAAWLGRPIVLLHPVLKPNHFVMGWLRFASAGRAVRWKDTRLVKAGGKTNEGPLSKEFLYAMMPREIADTYQPRTKK